MQAMRVAMDRPCCHFLRDPKMRRIQLIFFAACITCMTAICCSQAVPTVDYRNVALGKDSIAQVVVQNIILPPIFQIRNGQASFVKLTSSATGPFQFVSDTSVIDISFAPNSFLVRFVPQDTGIVTAQMTIAREINFTYQSVPGTQRDTFFVLLTGRGLPVIIPSRTISVFPSTFHLFSINYTLNNTTIDTTLARTFGPYSETEWRLFSYIPGLQRYVEYSGPSGNKRNASGFFITFRRGDSYFLISRVRRSFTIPGIVLTSIRDGTMTLNRGWNLAASPYPFDIDWDYTIREQKIQSRVSRARAFTADGFEPNDNTGIIKNTEGYFIFFRDSLAQYPVRPQFVTSFKKQNFVSSQDDWMISMTMRLGSDRSTHAFGQNAEALDGFDSYDFPSPPLPMQRSRLVIHEPNDPEYSEYMDDIRSAKIDGEAWDFEVVRESAERQCILTINELVHLPSRYLMFILDKDRQRLPDVSSSRSYNFSFDENQKRRRFTLFVGKKEFIERHTSGYSLTFSDYRLNRNFPNPVSAAEEMRTYISFALPRTELITMTVFDVFGREVKNIFKREYEAGENTISIDVSDLAAGTYFYRLSTTSGWSAARKLVVMR